MTTSDPELTAGDRLISRLRPLLASDRSRVTRLVGRRAGQLSWLVVPSLRDPLVLLPPNAPAASVLLRASGTGKPSAHLRVLAWLQRRTWLRRLPLPMLVVRTSEPSPYLLTVLQLLFPPVVDVAVRLGRPRHRRPWILLPINDDGAVAAVVKVATGEARGTLEREYSNLARVSCGGVPGMRSPAPLGYFSVGELDLLAMEPLLTSQQQAPRPVPVQVMRDLAQMDGASYQRLDAVPHLRSMRRRAAELAAHLGDLWLVRALEGVAEQFGHVELGLGTWHGDWVPWNMARRSSELLLWDWEHMESGVPLGWDHAHYLAQDLRGRVGTDQVAERSWLQEAREALQTDWGLDAEQTQASLLLYLVEVNLRFLEDRLQDDPGAERLGWSRSLIEALLAEPTRGESR